MRVATQSETRVSNFCVRYCEKYEKWANRNEVYKYTCIFEDESSCFWQENRRRLKTHKRAVVRKWLMVFRGSIAFVCSRVKSLIGSSTKKQINRVEERRKLLLSFTPFQRKSDDSIQLGARGYKFIQDNRINIYIFNFFLRTILFHIFSVIQRSEKFTH